ncbi:hypothetical protein C1Y18_11555 [Pseudomonas sp. MPR-R5A]|jgi:hypothetical protein|uniref:Uncharacterized protein n=3 Tax=Pseudomonas TaxID=286 RepID=A0ACA7P6H9_9PSED|nr:hypothetical protein U771_15175 [Pseudomonas sp. TKP]PMY07958.1 hypothetical protein C1Y18_11555 [Pseudomonas sp. MPR-R5A]PNA62840.1 hypothetical protein C1Y14_27700 [Pseudomonas sp. MPR-R5B]DAH70236.1 MAG TPA: hypothetical protein [Bacteriophage sp.]
MDNFIYLVYLIYTNQIKEIVMSKNVQFILNDQEKPVFAVLPYQAYLDLIKDKDIPEELTVASSLISSDGLKIRLPYGGPGAEIDLIRLVDFCRRASIISMSINARQQTLDKFENNQLGSLEYLLRTQFLPKDSPYKNTMQATSDVVDALEQTGIFRRSKRDFPGYYRPVLALDYIADQGDEFMRGRKLPLFNKIEPFHWVK